MKGFKESPNTLVITLKEILDGAKPILYVSHDEEDGMWQFLDGSDELDTEKARIVTLQEILELDETLYLLDNLPLGWVAERVYSEDEWNRRKK